MKFPKINSKDSYCNQYLAFSFKIIIPTIAALLIISLKRPIKVTNYL